MPTNLPANILLNPFAVTSNHAYDDATCDK